jgi:hypothetical protein
MRSSMNPSTQDDWVVGVWTAVGLAIPSGWSLLVEIGVGVMGCTRFWSSRESQSSQAEISLARSVTISEKRHQVSKSGDPPNVSGKAR